ncbi:MAG: hypothetical protein ACRD1T_11320, partial [Acidimicrobiia bacterium]
MNTARRRQAFAFVTVSAVVWSFSTASIFAQPADATPQQLREEINRLQRELEQLRQQQNDGLAALEAKVATLQGSTTQPTTVTAPQAQVPAGAAGAGGPTGALPVYGNVNILSKVFNPDIAVIGDFLGAAGENRVRPAPSFEMHETEASLQAIVDPYARADFFLSFGQEGVELEEGFITFTSLPVGLLAKVGKFRGSFGKVNTLHNHVLPWTDRPLVTDNLVGGEDGISDVGMSVSRLIPNPVLFLEATGEVFRGDSQVFRTQERGDLTYLGHVRGYRDLTEATNVDLGASIAVANNNPSANGTTNLFGIDATVRYRPLRRAIYRRVLARTELIWRRDEVPLRESAFGAYAATDYQFARRWFVGARYDYSERPGQPFLKDKGGAALLTFWPSEFSQVRGQFR